MITIFFIAMSLSFDSFATAVSIAIKNKKHTIKIGLTLAFVFALFQGVMSYLGYVIGVGLAPVIAHIDHWVAFVLLAGIGIRFIFEAFEKDDNKNIQHLNWKVIILLGLATSIDALVVGVTFAFMSIQIFSSLIIISFVTFILTFLGYWIGKGLSGVDSKKVEIFGGIILTGIGVKILLEHVLF